MKEHVEYADFIFDTLNSLETPVSPELLKLLGAVHLGTATLVGVIKSQSLRFLSTFLPTMIRVLDYSNNIDTSTCQDDVCRGRLLLIRSVLSAMASIISDLPSFAHPFILEIINICLKVYGSAMEQETTDIIHNEVNRCLGLIVSEIPPRTLIPCLEKGISSLLAISHSAAKRMCELLGEMIG